MNSVILIVTALLALLGIALILKRSRSPQKQLPAANPTPELSSSSRFHAVSIQFEKDACNAVKAAGDQRFLATESPQLPLPGCDAMRCNCHFKHHDDRRSGKDRRNPFSPDGFSGATGRFKTERRQGGDRRKASPAT